MIFVCAFAPNTHVTISGGRVTARSNHRIEGSCFDKSDTVSFGDQFREIQSRFERKAE